ncbi:hypothetical protein HO100_06095 [Corynebacterium ulcerans]|uniref:Uncharacterized protein n=1 Tax=Corynebacterium ulcerans FRC58 TaxID=1408268 RepID=A0ABM5U1Z8_CORUL|nr:hypothetical protein [Corynebacterium ulcerans]AKN77242.1 Hypothetical protein CulFRC58_1388 [Corynebacterium ulcerans FRC58]NOL62356.1 hypothetical protein [Corynebacterium ulcerans]NON15952.1 hypothetical protein [Corynebacterium ulcerans]
MVSIDTDTAVESRGKYETKPWAVLIIPSSPALVSELSPDAASSALRECARYMIEDLSPTSIDIVGTCDTNFRTNIEGSFKAWGAPQVNVGKGFYLPELIARYVAGPFIEDNPTVDVSEIRPRLGKPRGGTLTIVVVDGSAGLTERAPLALLDAGEETHQLMEKLLAGGPHALHDGAEKEKFNALLTPENGGVVHPDLWHEVSELEVEEAFLALSDSSLGVGRFVAVWKGTAAGRRSTCQ